MSRVYLRGHSNIVKRLLFHTAGFNFGLLLRQLTGVGTPRSLQGRAQAALAGALVRADDPGSGLAAAVRANGRR